MKITFSTIIVQNSGLYEIQKKDIAMIFFLTVENTYDCKIPVSVYSIQCFEGDPFDETSNFMYLVGGEMGVIERKRTKNITLIYPNLYLRNRVGKCLVSLRFQTDETGASEEVQKEIYFNSNRAFKNDQIDKSEYPYVDSTGLVDCVTKYSSRRSFYNHDLKVCQAVPECPPNMVYLPKSNICRKVKEPVCPADLEMIEMGYIERRHSVSNMVYFDCHHGVVNNKTGECVCDEGWTSSSCRETVYHPSLGLYHMCNIQINSWERENRQKIIITIAVLMILAIAIAAKMLLAVCLLNWCCHFIKSKASQDDVCDDEICPYSYCGDEECPAKNNPTRTIRVSFSHLETNSEDTDVTSSKSDDSGKSNICHCDGT